MMFADMSRVVARYGLAARTVADPAIGPRKAEVT